MIIVKQQITVDAQPKRWRLNSGIKEFYEYSHSRSEFVDRKEIINYIENVLNTNVSEENNILFFIWENMEFTVDFDKKIFVSSRWGMMVPIEEMKSFFAGVMDNIEFCKTFGITNKEEYIDQIWLRTGW